MTLSEAIRLGAMLRPQAFTELFADGGSCALGAACEAVGCGPTYAGLATLAGEQHWPVSPFVRERCPECGSRPAYIIPHLNDSHRWTRERIADWVEGLERARARAAAKAPVVQAQPQLTQQPEPVGVRA